VADPISEERLREIASSDPLTLAICAQISEPSWADVRAIAAELLAARADLREAMELLRAFNFTIATGTLGLHERRTALLEKHKETP
jgi:alpha-D-ribose 1-methylphosphonate 5-triphosphate synthase subunit PhnI